MNDVQVPPQQLLKPKRTIPVYFTDEELGPQLVKRLVTWWGFQVPLRSMIQKTTADRRAQGKPLLSYVDLYSFLYHKLQTGQITQRGIPRHELKIEQFKEVFYMWRHGSSYKDIAANLIQIYSRLPSSECFIKSVIRSLNERHATTKKKEEEKADKIQAKVTTAASLGLAADTLPYFVATQLKPKKILQQAAIDKLTDYELATKAATHAQSVTAQLEKLAKLPFSKRSDETEAEAKHRYLTESQQHCLTAALWLARLHERLREQLKGSDDSHTRPAETKLSEAVCESAQPPDDDDESE